MSVEKDKITAFMGIATLVMLLAFAIISIEFLVRNWR